MYHYSLKAFAQVGKKEASLSFLSCQTCHWKCEVFSNAEWPPKYMVMCLQIALQDISLKQACFLAIKEKTQGEKTQNSRKKLKTQEKTQKVGIF